MKLYIVRSVKYIIRMVILLSIVLLLMYLTGTLNVEAGSIIDVLFCTMRGWILLLLLLLLALFYPKLSFTTVDIRGNLDADRQRIVDAFRHYGFSLVRENDDIMIFGVDSALKKVMMQWDDKVTVTAKGNYIEMEGLKKIVSRVETRLKSGITE